MGKICCELHFFLIITLAIFTLLGITCEGSMPTVKESDVSVETEPQVQQQTSVNWIGDGGIFNFLQLPCKNFCKEELL